VDLVAFAVIGGALRVLFVRRKHDPFAGCWALPGGFLELDEPVEAGARRELREETGLEIGGPVAPIGFFGDPGRDPRGRTISLAHAAVVPHGTPLASVRGGDDAAEATWLDPRSPGDLAFDHAAILATALAWLARAVDEGPAGLRLLAEEFGDDDIKDLFHALGKSRRGAMPWRKRQFRAARIIAIAETTDRFRKTSR
jgi:8-oxo-dGTP diphosphatase